MEIATVIENTTRNLNNDLRECFLREIDNEEIPICPTEAWDEKRAITIFVTLDSKVSKKNKSKNAQPKLTIEFCETLDFDILKIRNNRDYISSIQFLWSIPVKAECVEPAKQHISHWARTLFTAARKLYKNDYGINLLMLPFEVCFDENDVLHLSKHPNFNDLWFADPANPKKRMDNTAFLEKQALSIIEAANKLAEMHNN